MTLRWPFARRTLHTSNAGSSPADAAGQPWPKRVDLHVVAFGIENLPPRRRVWLQLARLIEIRLYRVGVEVFVGPSRCFLSLAVGSEGFEAMVVRAHRNDRFLGLLRDYMERS